MLVERLLPAARRGLVTLAENAFLLDAAGLLRTGTDIVAVCDDVGTLVGVITKTDVVTRISACLGASCRTAASAVMTREVVLCHPEDRLHEVWEQMKARRLKSVPVVDRKARPVGVLNARDVLEALLGEAQDEEALLRDFVMCVGYR